MKEGKEGSLRMSWIQSVKRRRKDTCANRQTIKEALEPVDDITRGAVGELNKLHSRPQSEREFSFAVHGRPIRLCPTPGNG